LERLCELSIASMDIESRTVDLDNRNPRPGQGVNYAEVNSSGLLGGHPLKVQKPLMIAHVDGLSRERAQKLGDSESSYLLLTASGDSDADVFAMMADYWKGVLIRHLEVSAFKAKLCRPLMDQVLAYHDAFFAFCEKWHRAETEDLKGVQSKDDVASAEETDQDVDDDDDDDDDSDESEEEEEDVLTERDYRRIADEEDLRVMLEAAKSKKDKELSALKPETFKKLTRRAWQASLHGRIQTSLERLVRHYTVFSFYG